MIDKKLVTNMRTKTNILNKFFAEQRTTFKNGSVLSSSQEFLTQARLCLLDFSNDKILKLIRSLNVLKARWQKMFDKSLVKPSII